MLTSNLQPNSSSIWKGIWKAGMQIKRWIGRNHNMELMWLGDSNGYFSVESVYDNLKQISEVALLEVMGECSDKSKIISFWRNLWRLKIQDKVKIFTWRLYHGFVPLGTVLSKRGCVSNKHCWFCNFREESANHVFLECWLAKAF